MKTLIVGRGEVGRALAEVLMDYRPDTIDKGEEIQTENVDILHVCIPYSAEFDGIVADYQRQYCPKFTVIHSTVPVGTSRKCCAIHSPIRGIHPNLVEGIRTFPKFIGGEHASEVADYFRRAGLKVMLFDDQETTELSKLLDTEYYRTCIEFARRAKDLCRQHRLNFHECYTIPNLTYNEGYRELGHPEYVRPVLQPIAGAIGGHCVLANKALLEHAPSISK